MKKIIVLLISVFALSTSLLSQIQFGFKAGLHSLDLLSESIILPGSDQGFDVDFVESEYGFQLGLYTRIKVFGLFIEPSAMLHSTSVNYTLDEIDDAGVIGTVRNEKFTNLDIPVMIGFKLFFAKAFFGPVAHLNIDRASDLFNIPSYPQRFDTATYGYQAGLGFEIWKLRLEVKYEGNLSRFGDQIYIGNEHFSLDGRPSRLLANVGYRF